MKLFIRCITWVLRCLAWMHPPVTETQASLQGRIPPGPASVTPGVTFIDSEGRIWWHGGERSGPVQVSIVRNPEHWEDNMWSFNA